MTIFIVNQSVEFFWAIKCKKILKNTYHKFLDPKGTSLNYLFSQTNSPKSSTDNNIKTKKNS